MYIRYDPEVDVLSVIFRETTVTSRELAEGIVAEYDAQERLAGLEILDVATRLAEPSIMREVTVEGVSCTEQDSSPEAGAA